MKRNAISGFSSRAVRLGFVCVVVAQLNAINKRATAYSVARALDCSPYTARKLLNEAVAVGDLSSITSPFKNTERTEYVLADAQFNDGFAKFVSQSLIKYHVEKSNE